MQEQPEADWLALHNYENLRAVSTGSFYNGNIIAAQNWSYNRGNFLVMLLPHFDQTALYNRIDFTFALLYIWTSRPIRERRSSSAKR